MTPTKMDEHGRGAEFTLSDGSTFGVWRFDEGGKTSGGTAMFAVGDINAAVAKFRDRGAKLSDPIESAVCFMSSITARSKTKANPVTPELKTPPRK